MRGAMKEAGVPPPCSLCALGPPLHLSKKWGAFPLASMAPALTGPREAPIPSPAPQLYRC
jgi:hypothetical protein